MTTPISDELLNAFVDGELDTAECERLYVCMRQDENLANRVCVLRSLKDMTRLAYAAPPCAAGKRSFKTKQRRVVRYYGTALMLLILGLGGGWLLHGSTPNLIAASPPPFYSQAIRLTSVADPGKVILHLDSGTPGKFKSVLDYADALLTKAERQGKPIQLEIIANNRGLDLLRADLTPFAGRIQHMSEQHTNLNFIACGQSVTRFTREGEEVMLIPQARVTSTAVDQIIGRLQQGWTYIKI